MQKYQIQRCTKTQIQVKFKNHTCLYKMYAINCNLLDINFLQVDQNKHFQEKHNTIISTA